MKIKQFKKTIRYEFDRSEKDQKQAWDLLDQFDPFYEEPFMWPNQALDSDGKKPPQVS